MPFVITGPDLTPEQRAKAYRTYRFSAVSNAVFAVLFFGLAIYEFTSRRRIPYLTLALGVAWSLLSLMAWSRMKKSR